MGSLKYQPAERLSPAQAVVGIAFSVVVAGYVLCTLLYNTPNNAVRVMFDEELAAFESWGYQKWTFFAPPPLDNDRLYFAFSSRKGEGVLIEVLQGIYKRKQCERPFNVRTEVIDYLVSGAARGIADSFAEVKRYEKVHVFYEGDPLFLDDIAHMYLDPTNHTEGANVRLLLRYAATVAAKSGLDPEGLKVQIAYSKLPLRPFMHRNNLDMETAEKVVFRTNLLDVPILK
jgi:hypothetical protein